MDASESCCIICKSELAKERRFALPKCGHVFCRGCLIDLMLRTSQHYVCPIDQRQIEVCEKVFESMRDIYEFWFADIRGPLYERVASVFVNYDHLKTLKTQLVSKMPTDFKLCTDPRMNEIAYVDDVLLPLLETYVSQLKYLIPDDRVDDDPCNQLANYNHYFRIFRASLTQTSFFATIDNHHLIWQSLRDARPGRHVWQVARLLGLMRRFNHLGVNSAEVYAVVSKVVRLVLALASHRTMQLKSLLLELGDTSPMSSFFDRSDNSCTVCSEKIFLQDHFVIGDCRHKLCEKCVKKYSILSPKCVFKCQGTSTSDEHPLNGSLSGQLSLMLERDLQLKCTSLLHLFTALKKCHGEFENYAKSRLCGESATFYHFKELIGRILLAAHLYNVNG